jgi:hypothetical protein
MNYFKGLIIFVYLSSQGRIDGSKFLSKSKADDINKEKEEEYIALWSSLKNLISLVEAENKTKIKKFEKFYKRDLDPIIIKNVETTRRIFLDILKQWNALINTDISNKKINDMEILDIKSWFFDCNNKIINFIEDINDIPSSIKDDILRYHNDKIIRFTNYVISDMIINKGYNNKIVRNKDILNYWSFGLCIFSDECDYIVDKITSRNYDPIELQNIEDKTKEMQNKMLKLQNEFNMIIPNNMDIKDDAK